MVETADQNLREYVTAVIGGQLFGLPILRVQDVFAPERLTTVPLAPAEIAGVLNLRGRIVTLINMRRRLGLGDQEGGGLPMAVGVESRGESYGLLIDSVGEVLKLDDMALGEGDETAKRDKEKNSAAPHAAGLCFAQKTGFFSPERALRQGTPKYN